MNKLMVIALLAGVLAAGGIMVSPAITFQDGGAACVILGLAMIGIGAAGRWRVRKSEGASQALRAPGIFLEVLAQNQSPERGEA